MNILMGEIQPRSRVHLVRQWCASQTPKPAVSGGCQRFKNRLNKPNPLWRAGDLSSLLPVVVPDQVEEGVLVIGSWSA